MADQAITATFDSAGEAVAALRVDSSRVWYRVTQVSVSTDDTTASSGGLYRDGIGISPFVPQFDAVAGDPPIELRAGHVLEAIWSGGTAGNTATALFIYDEIDIGGPSATRGQR